MQDSIHDIIERAASLAMSTDESDLQGLVELLDNLTGLASAAREAGETRAQERATLAGELVESVVMRNAEDTNTALDNARKTIAEIQNLLSGRPATEADRESSRDPELIADWADGVNEQLAEIEADALAIDDGSAEENTLGNIRRSLHTVKGECGVLSLPRAQAICHEVESSIADGAPLLDDPSATAELLLALLDWLRSYAAALLEDPHAMPPQAPAIILTLMGESAEAAADTAPADVAIDETQATPAVEALVEPAAPEPEKETPEQITAAEAPVADPQQAESTDAGSPEHIEAAAPAPAPIVDDTPVDFGAATEDPDGVHEFVSEAREHLAHAEECALRLELDAEDYETLNTIFRGFHTIKGVAGFMGLVPIVRLAHQAETLLDLARTKTLHLDSARIDLVLQSCDFLSGLLNTLEGGEAPTEGELATLIADLERGCVPGEIAVNAASHKHAAAAPSQDDSPQPTATDAGQASASSAAAATPAPTPTNKPAARPAPAKGGRQANKPAAAAQSVKVSTTRVDHLMNLVGELVIAHQMVVQDDLIQEIKSQRTHRNLAHSRKIVRDLQEVAMSLRMVTVRGTFQKMARLVRDTAAKNGKQIDFIMEGDDTEVDRTVVEEIADPLVHMVRNSCDHGIETPDDRVASGKSPNGRLTLRAYHRGGSIIIEIADDGRGLNREKILSKAAERGLIAPERDPAEIPDAEVFAMIFLPGFSTADKVTDISGRGVGMDVVRRNIENLRGKIEIESKSGEGSIFRLCLPLTMAIIDGMIVRAGEQRYVIPTLSIEQSFRPVANQISSVAGGSGQMVSVRGTLIPIYHLGVALGIEGGLGTAEEAENALLIVLESNGMRFALVVDDILGQQQVVIKSLGEDISQLPGVSGGAILGDGRVALILDVAGVLARATKGAKQKLQGVSDGG